MGPVDVELEKGIRGAKLRDSIDALYQDIVFEFKRDLKRERERDSLSRVLAPAKDDLSCQERFQEWDKLRVKGSGHNIA